MSIPIQFAQDLWVRKAFSAIGHTVLVYDYFLTFRDEVKYIWKSPWTIVKATFLLNRYGNLIMQTFIQLEETGLLSHNSHIFCRRFVLATTVYMLLSMESIHILVLMRAWAIWGTGRRMSQILLWSYVIYFIIQLAGALWTVESGHVAHFKPAAYTKVCVGGMPSLAWLSYFGSFILDTLLFILTMRSLRKYSREFRYLYPSGLLNLLIRDAVLFFIVSIFSDALTMASWIAFAGNPKYFLGKGFANPILSVAGQRLVLNLRGLKTHTYATRDLSREVDRQLEGFGELDNSIALDDLSDLEIVREASESQGA